MSAAKALEAKRRKAQARKRVEAAFDALVRKTRPHASDRKAWQSAVDNYFEVAEGSRR